MRISLVRADGKRGVDFDSPETLQIFLDFIQAMDDPSTRHFIPVLENGGIIPKNMSNPSFDALLKRMGIVVSDIPNSMRSHFLVAFQEGGDIQMTWWKTTPLDRQQSFIAYLKKAAQIKNLPLSIVEDQKRLERLIVPILEKREAWIPEDIDGIQMLARCWKMTNYQLATEIRRLWERMTGQLSAYKAGRIVNRTAGTMRYWVREGKINFNVNKKGHLTFTREILIDHIK